MDFFLPVRGTHEFVKQLFREKLLYLGIGVVGWS